MMNFSNELTPSETERLAVLAEEMGEALQMIGKILRHGYESRHPNGGPTNRQSLVHELGDIQYAVSLMVEKRDLIQAQIDEAQHFKSLTVAKYLHHQAALATREKGEG